MGKIQVYIDFDNTMVDTNKALVKILNEKFNMHRQYSRARKYDLSDLFPDVTDDLLDEIFTSKELFDKLEVFKGCEDMLNFFQDEIDATIVTVGSKENLALKQDWFVNTPLHVSAMVCLDDEGTDKEKNKVNMENGVMIDDKIDVLRNCNAKVKILFRNNLDTEWNRVEANDNVYVVNSWDEISSIIGFYVEQDGVI